MSEYALARRQKRLRTLMDEGDAAGLAEETLKVAAECRGRWDGDWHWLAGELRGLPVEQRRSLADEFVRRFPAVSDREFTRQGTLLMLAHLVPDLPGDYLVEERRAELDDIGRLGYVPYASEFVALANAELAAGRAVTPPIVVTLRYSLSRHSLGHLAEPVLNPGEEWADRALEKITGIADDPWRALLLHALTATAAKPTAKWDKPVKPLIEELGADLVRETLLDWLALVGRPRTYTLDVTLYQSGDADAFDSYNVTALRGLAWVLSLLPPHPDTARALGRLVETSLRKVPGLGPRSPKVANAGVVSLARIPGEAALAELARLATRVTYKSTAKVIDTSLQARATALGLSRAEIEELAVPAYGLTDVGAARQQLGEATALLEIHGTRAVLGWHNAAGKTVRSVPATVRREHAEELKELKAAVKDIDRMLSAQSERLDRMFLARRSWAYDVWRGHYLDHPLVGTLARRLLWTVDGIGVGFADGELRTLTDEPVTAGAQVELWHPVGRGSAEVIAWRDWLERHAITQPFKQAHREVYLLTDAERATGSYSNRFAAHILRQYQFHSLTAVRGWSNKLRLSVDDSLPPATRELPQWNLRAEYWIHGDGDEWGVDTTDTGSFLRLNTDQVRFYPADAPWNTAHCDGGPYHAGNNPHADPVPSLPLTEIPPLVLSEVLRDVDLFVGVASVGNDPTWQDGGPGGRFRQYWHAYGFGRLNQSAETRRALLERLVPRLAIADRCTLEGRFLHVKGELHTYKIHLGSGNILMTPDDAYLCIVPKAQAQDSGTGYLPFEGDRTLAIILSKAMLLAKDTEITDPTILSQL